MFSIMLSRRVVIRRMVYKANVSYSVIKASCDKANGVQGEWCTRGMFSIMLSRRVVIRRMVYKANVSYNVIKASCDKANGVQGEFSQGKMLLSQNWDNVSF